jgi:monoamine oxidase
MFGADTASKRLVSYKTIHWAKEPYIWGAYSFAAPHSIHLRKELFKPIGRQIFFAGEATHFEGYNSTVQGALETGTWAAEEIMLDWEQQQQVQQ